MPPTDLISKGIMGQILVSQPFEINFIGNPLHCFIMTSHKNFFVLMLGIMVEGGGKNSNNTLKEI